MPHEIQTLRYGGVNCYLIKTSSSFILIDTGFPKNRAEIENDLIKAGCQRGNLKLIIVTHADFDHTGNCAYLRQKYGSKIVMHRDESRAVEKGSMLLNRKQRGAITGAFFNAAFKVVMLFLRFGKFEKFKPDRYVDEGADFLEYGFLAKVLHIPGHSRGSIGILIADGDLFCGDLLINDGKPSLNTLIDNSQIASASVDRLKKLRISMVYPGHGNPFKMERYVKGAIA